MFCCRLLTLGLLARCVQRAASITRAWQCENLRMQRDEQLGFEVFSLISRCTRRQGCWDNHRFVLLGITTVSYFLTTRCSRARMQPVHAPPTPPQSHYDGALETPACDMKRVRLLGQTPRKLLVLERHYDGGLKTPAVVT